MTPHQPSPHQSSKNLKGLIIGSVGIVFGDIGTSPLYAMKETFGGQHPMPVEPERVLGVLSLMFWTIMALVTLKYVAIIMRADNRGEGGSLVAPKLRFTTAFELSTKLLSITDRVRPRLNVNESERERSGLICQQFCGVG